MSLTDFGLIDAKKEHAKKKEMFDALTGKGTDLREAETIAFKPDKLKKSSIKIKDTTIKKILFYFNSDEEIELVRKHFKILDFIELNNKNSDLLIALLKMIEVKAIQQHDIERFMPDGKLR